MLVDLRQSRKLERRARDARRGRLGKGVFDALVRELAGTIRLAFQAGATASLFGLEGPLRHGIRSDLCLQGWKWRDADAMARELLGMRAARSGRACAFCGHPVPDDLKKGTKYCSPACRSAVQYGLALDRLPARPCAACGKTFDPFSPDQRHCSRECIWVTRRAEGKVPQFRIKPRPCRCCGKVFRPEREKKGRFCSHGCASQALRYLTAVRFDQVWSPEGMG